VIPALSTITELPFLIPSVAPLIASPKSSIPCRPKEAESLNTLKVLTDSSALRPEANKFFNDAAVSANGIKPSFDNSFAALVIKATSLPVPAATDCKPIKAFSSLIASPTALVVTNAAAAVPNAAEIPAAFKATPPKLLPKLVIDLVKTPLFFFDLSNVDIRVFLPVRMS